MIDITSPKAPKKPPPPFLGGGGLYTYGSIRLGSLYLYTCGAGVCIPKPLSISSRVFRLGLSNLG